MGPTRHAAPAPERHQRPHGLRRPPRGELVAHDRAGLTALRTAVGLVFQNPDDQLFAGSVYQDVSFGPLNIGLSEDVTRDRVEEALESLYIAHLRIAHAC